MPPAVSWGLLPDILSRVAFHTNAEDIRHSEVYKTATGIFFCLCRWQRNDGALYDHNVASTLDDQYHYANLTLSAVVLSTLQSDAALYDIAVKSLGYYLSVPLDKKISAVDFSNFALLMTCLLLRDSQDHQAFKRMLRDYIEKMHHHAVVDGKHAYGNNFITMRAVNHLLRYKILGYCDDEKQAYALIGSSLQWQFPDGVFYDYPRSFNDAAGVPSLTYHAKMTLMTLLFGIISREQHIIASGLRGLDALSGLMARDGEAFYYGRSNNALYGYASGMYAMQLAAAYLKNGPKALEYQGCARRLAGFINRQKAEDGHLHIVPNKDEGRRCGYDSYMYITVYNAFTMSMLLLSAMVKDIPLSEKAPDRGDSMYHLRESGFIVKKSACMETAINAKGHNYYQQYLLDPRYTCGTPLFVRYRGKDMLPTIPFSYPPNDATVPAGALHKVVRILRRAVATARCWEHLQRFNPLHAGFLPCIETAGKLYLPLQADRADVTRADDKVCIMLSGNLTSIFQKGLRPVALLLCEFAAAFMNVPLHRLRRLLVRRTDLPFERQIIIGSDFLHFLDHLPVIRGGDYFFTLRTYAAWGFKHEQDRAQWSGNGSGIIMPLQQQSMIQKYAAMGSSKGWADCWKITGEHHQAGRSGTGVTFEHSIIFFDGHTAPEHALERFRALHPALRTHK